MSLVDTSHWALSPFFSHSLSLSLTHTRSICYHNLVDIKMDALWCIRFPHVAKTIFSYLDFKTLISCFRVCKTYNHLLSSPSFWLGKMQEHGFSREQLNPWIQLIDECRHLTAEEDTLTVLIGMRCHLYFVINNSQHETATIWIKQLRPYVIAHHYHLKDMLKLIIERTNHSLQRQYLCVLFEDLLINETT